MHGMAPVAEEIRPKYDIWEGSYDTAGIVDDPAVAEAFTSGRLLGHGGQVTEVLGDGHVQLDNGTRLKVSCADGGIAWCTVLEPSRAGSFPDQGWTA